MLRHIHVLSLAVGLLIPVAIRADDAPFRGKTKSEWIRTLRENESSVRRQEAVAALSLMEPKDGAILDSIAEAMVADKAERVRFTALDGADAIFRGVGVKEKPARFVAAFGKCMSSDASDNVRLKAAGIAKKLQREELKQLVPVLSEMLQSDKSAPVRAAAATALGMAGDNAKTVVNIMVEGLKDKEATVRAAVLEAFGRIGDEAKGTVSRIIPLLKDQDAGVRLSAAFALGRIGPDASVAVPDLSQTLTGDSDATVRKEAARAFAFLGLDAKAGIPALAKALREDKSEEVRQQCALALGKMGGDVHSAVPAMLEAMQKDTDKTVRTFVVHSLGNTLGSNLKEHVKLLAEQLLKDTEGDVRLAIIQELASLGPDAKEALPALKRMTADVQLTVRDEAKRAVKKVSGEK